MRGCVVGLGYVGLPTALELAAHGVEIVGVDCREDHIAALCAGKLAVVEPGMEELFLRAREGGIRFANDCQAADFYVLAVQTPWDSEARRADLSYVEAAFRSALEVCPAGAAVILESTVPPGTTEMLLRPLAKASGKHPLLAHVPERILPGNLLWELENGCRVIGTEDMAAKKVATEIYRTFCKGELFHTSIKTAEAAKTAENAFRDVNIAFANELARLCRAAGADVYEVIRAANTHPRVAVLQPGPGVGGHCLPVDPWFLAECAPEEARLIPAARAVNDGMSRYVLARLRELMRHCGISDFSRVGIYGLSYKADVDDIRGSPTLALLDLMAQEGEAAPLVYDPLAGETPVVRRAATLEAFLAQVDAVVLMTAHRELLEQMKLLDGKAILDTRNCCCLSGKWGL